MGLDCTPLSRAHGDTVSSVGFGGMMIRTLRIDGLNDRTDLALVTDRQDVSALREHLTPTRKDRIPKLRWFLCLCCGKGLQRSVWLSRNNLLVQSGVSDKV